MLHGVHMLGQTWARGLDKAETLFEGTLRTSLLHNLGRCTVLYSQWLTRELVVINEIQISQTRL